MPTLFETKYPNNSRVVSGVVTIYRDDVVLLCDTSSAPVTINLFDIPDDYWSTQWKLYIIDNSNNASVNNITINAGSGQFINTQASLVLNTNGSGALIRIVSNTNFIGNLTFVSGGGGGGGYDTIENEGVALPQRTTMNFVGEYVEATDNVTKTDVTINPIIKEVTNAQLLTLMNTNTLIKGLEYKVTDAPYLQSITLMAIANNRVESEGKGLLFVADYQKVGDYSGIAGFNAQIGIWNGTLVPVVGDVAIWNNVHYLNLTGVNTTTAPNLDFVNWAELIKSEIAGYILEPVMSEYNPITNDVRRIRDVRLNCVDLAINKGQNTFLNFPFGNNAFSDNTVVGNATIITLNVCNAPIEFFKSNIIDNSLVDLDIDFTVISGVKMISITNNILYATSQLEIITSDISTTLGINFSANFILGGNLAISNISNTFNSYLTVANNKILEDASLDLGFGAGSSIVGGNLIQSVGNYINKGGNLYVRSIDSSIQQISVLNNMLWDAADVSVSLSNRADFKGNRIYYPQSINLGTLTDNQLNGAFCVLSLDESTFKASLDLSDPLIYDGINFTLDLASYSWAGEFRLTNGTANQINKLLNYSFEKRPITLVADSGAGVLAFRLGYVAIGAVVADEIVDNTNLTVKSSFRSYGTRNERATLIKNNGAWFIQSRENWT